jgi:hypothetical protein
MERGVLPTRGKGDPQTAATGVVMRPATVRRYAIDAGFRDIEILPIDTRYFRLYRLIR